MTLARGSFHSLAWHTPWFGTLFPAGLPFAEQVRALTPWTKVCCKALRTGLSNATIQQTTDPMERHRRREGGWNHPLNNLILECEQLTIKTPLRAKWGPSYPGTTHNPSGPFSGPCRLKQTWRREQHSSQGAFLEPAEEPLFSIFFFF